MSRIHTLSQPFLANAVKPADGIRQLPITDDKGITGIFTNVEIKQVKDKEKSAYMELRFETQNGEVGYARLNIFNEDELVAKRAWEDFSSISYSLGLQNTPISDLDMILNKPLNACVRKCRNLSPKERDAGETESKFTEIYAWRNYQGLKAWDLPEQTQAPTQGFQAPQQGGFAPPQAPSQGFSAPQQGFQAPPAQQGFQAPAQQGPTAPTAVSWRQPGK